MSPYMMLLEIEPEQTVEAAKGFMDYLLEGAQWVLNLGAAAMLPIMIIVLGLFFRMRLGAAIKAGLLVGIGFQGLGLVIGLLSSTIGPVTEYYKGLGVATDGASRFTTIDVGFPAVGAASWSVSFAPLAVPLIVLTNLIMLRLRWTKTMNVDIWNYIHFLIPGAMAYALFGSFWLGLGITVGLSAITLIVADKVAPHWQEYFGLEGTTCSTLSFTCFTWPVAVLVNKLLDLIPGINKVDIDMSKIEKRLGFFGDPAFVGLIVGLLLGVITKQDTATVIKIGMGISAVLILIPRMVGIMMEGLAPLGGAASAFMKKHMKEDAELYIGMDIALGLGDPACITTTVFAIPFCILLAFVIPDMSYFPIAILGVICYVVPMCVMASKGNLLRCLVTACFSVFYIVYFSNMFAPEATEMMKITQVDIAEGQMVTDGFFGFDPGCVVIGFINRLFGGA